VNRNHNTSVALQLIPASQTRTIVWEPHLCLREALAGENVPAILACSEAAQVAVQLERGSLERLDARAIDGLLDLIDSPLDRLTRLRRRIWRERQRRGG
jgi:hypothetical protein